VSEPTSPDRLGPPLPESLIIALKENGIDINDKHVLEVARLTYQYSLVSALVQPPYMVEGAAVKELTERTESAAVRELLQLQVNRKETAQVKITIGQVSISLEKLTWRAIAATLGIASAIYALLSAYQPFIDVLNAIIRRGGIGMIFISTAYAENAPTLQNPISLTPVLIYLIYSLFAIAYILIIVAAFIYCKTPRMQANAFDGFKLLTAFFIGAATGHA
jgi:hypothetical protein